MSQTRRTFLGTAAGAVGLGLAGPRSDKAEPPAQQERPAGIDPWIEVDAAALRTNALEAARIAGDRPVMAVIKNNGYGLGTVEVARALDEEPAIEGFAVVKVSAALQLKTAGVRTPVLHMGATTDEEAEELARAGVRLSFFSPDDRRRLVALGSRLGAPIPGHVYVDTGMRRLGVPAHRALPWLREISGTPAQLEGAFMGFTEEEFDYEQLERFRDLTNAAATLGISLGPLHAASSHGLFLRPEAHLDMIRPGLVLYGARPSGVAPEDAALRPAFRLRARVARVERLRAGDSVSYGRSWTAERPTWTATLPVGHADGYPRRAVEGCEVLIGNAVYPVVGAVSASHTIVVLGEDPTVEVGDIATLVGPDHPAIHPNEISARTSSSVYDVLMHLGQSLPRIVV